MTCWEHSGEARRATGGGGISQRGIVEHGVSQHPFQPAVLVLQCPQPLRLG